MNKTSLIACLVTLFFPFYSWAQPSCFPIDTLSANEVVLKSINLRTGNIYSFNKFIEQDSVFFVLAPNLPKGYYEAYYLNDTNRLALTYNNFGTSSYSQQYYLNGAMKSDSEYDKRGFIHGLHILYNQEGNEIWHAEYTHGHIDKKYTLEYVEVYNFTKELIARKRLEGCYVFYPTAMRARMELIRLRADGTFSYFNPKADCDCYRRSEGVWTEVDSFLILETANKLVWKEPRKFAILTNLAMKKPKMVEVLPWGANWYASEYWLCKKCPCEP